MMKFLKYKRKIISKVYFSFTLILITVIACNQNKSKISKRTNDNYNSTQLSKTQAMQAGGANQDLKLPNDNIHNDEVRFLFVNNDGDMPVVYVEKDKKLFGLYISDSNPVKYDETLGYNRGDVIRIKWQLEKINEDDGDFSEILLNSEIIKPGKLTDYNKNHRKKIDIDDQSQNVLTRDELKRLYNLARYYLAYSTDKDFQSSVLEAENTDERVGSLMYSFSTEMLKNKSYIRIEFNYLYQGQLSTLKTIFTDRDTYQIFEYNEATGALLNWK